MNGFIWKEMKILNELVKKILEKLDEERELSYADFSRYVDEVSPCLDAEYDDFFHRGLERASRLVKEVAAEYNGGWIPCSERFPEDDNYILLSFSNFTLPLVGRFEDNAFYIGDEVVSCVSQDLFVNAWMPLPEPYKGE